MLTVNNGPVALYSSEDDAHRALNSAVETYNEVWGKDYEVWKINQNHTEFYNEDGDICYAICEWEVH